MVSQDIFGFIGGVLTTASMVPQVVRLYKMKSALEISLPFTMMLLAGLLCWLSYGIVFDLFPVILWNAVGAALGTMLLFAKLKYGRQK